MSRLYAFGYAPLARACWRPALWIVLVAGATGVLVLAGRRDAPVTIVVNAPLPPVDRPATDDAARASTRDLAATPQAPASAEHAARDTQAAADEQTARHEQVASAEPIERAEPSVTAQPPAQPQSAAVPEAATMPERATASEPAATSAPAATPEAMLALAALPEPAQAEPAALADPGGVVEALPDGAIRVEPREAEPSEPPTGAARHALRRWHNVLRPGIVRSKSGATARVHQRHAEKFQCLVDWLDAQGFRIAAMGGYARRAFAGSLHPIGAALDIDQISRNRLLRGKRFPAGVNEAAARCGLVHGDRTVWPNYPDYGHFQVAGVSRGGFARRRQHTPVFGQGGSQPAATAPQPSTAGLAAPQRAATAPQRAAAVPQRAAARAAAAVPQASASGSAAYVPAPAASATRARLPMPVRHRVQPARPTPPVMQAASSNGALDVK